MSKPKVLILGPPGAGKGTQSTRIAEEFDVEHVSTGDMLRANKDMETEHGTPREYMEAGDLVPDEVMEAVVEEGLSGREGFVLDGYPRTLEQAEFLEGVTDLEVILYVEVPREELIDRLTGRRVCDDCGTNYHVEYDQPETEGVCDECGGNLIQREDDQADTVRNRLDVYHENTAPVVEHYEDRAAFVTVDGDRAPDAVWDDVRAAIADA
jgi:adenylate kinase